MLHSEAKKKKRHGQSLSGTEEERQRRTEAGAGMSLPPMPLPRPPVATDQCQWHNQKPVRLTLWVCPECLLNYDENFSKCPI